MQLNPNTLYVGLDIALAKFDVSMLDINSTSYLKTKCTFTNNATGMELLVHTLSQIAKENNFSKIMLGFEATGNYGFHIPFSLHSSSMLKEVELTIFQINPKIIKNFRKAFNELPKTDAKDCYLIAERLKIGKLPPYTKFDPHYFALRILTRQRFDIVKQIVREKSRFLSTLFLKAPGFIQASPFSDLFGSTSLSMLTEFSSIEEIVEKDISELVAFIISKSKNKIANPQQLAEQLKYIARESYKPNRVMHDSLNHALLASWRHIKFLKDELKQLDKEIALLIPTFANQYQVLTSIKGIGPVFAAGIIAELGDISLFKTHKQVAKYAGLIWRITQSGNYEAEETSLTKAGNRYLRYYLVQAAQLLSTINSDFIPYYSRKYNEAVKHKHKRAVVLLARKLIRVIHSLLKQNKLYSTPKLPSLFNAKTA